MSFPSSRGGFDSRSPLQNYFFIMSIKFDYENYFSYIIKKKGNFLITGCPGTGKSFFLIQFIKYLICNQKINENKIIVFTFNRKASKFYRDEVSLAISSSLNEIQILTFYSFCFDFLNNYLISNIIINNALNNNSNIYSDENSISKFNNILEGIKLLTAPQQWELITNILNNLDKNNYFHVVKLLNSSSFTRVSIIQEIFDFILRSKENLLTPQDLSKKFTPYVNELMSEINNIYLKYNQELENNNLYDYGRILQETERILNTDKKILSEYKQKYDFIIVDDLQEINYAQAEIIKKISNNNIVFFGNDDESIYSFRGSNINNFFSFYKTINKENIIFLNKNFRNNFLINEISNKFISKNNTRIIKASKDSNNDNDGVNLNSNEKKLNKFNGEVIVKSFNNLHEELNFILSKIYYLNKINNIKLKDIAIILKGSEFETGIIENFLIQNNVNYYLRNSRSAPSSKYVKFILNIANLSILINEFNKYLKHSLLSENKTKFTIDINENNINKKIHNEKINNYKNIGNIKNNSNQIDFLIKNLLSFEFFKINPLFFKEVESIYLSQSNRFNNNLWQFLIYNLKYFKNIDEKNFKKLSNFIKLINKFSKKVNSNSFSFFIDLIKDEKTGFKERFLNYDKLDNSEKNLIKVLNDYLKSIKNFSKENLNNNSLVDYFYYIDKLRDNQFIEEIEESDKDINKNDGVRIISFYESKNYEFEAVFIPFLNKGYFPSDFYKPQIYDNKIFQMFLEKYYPTEEEVKKIHEEEERKIIYVGLTRAKNFLYVTSNKYKKQSTFFIDIYNDYKNLKEKEKFKNEEDGKTNSNNNYKNNEFNYYIDYFNYLRNKWLLKKKAIVATYRINENLFYDTKKYKDYILFLNSIYNFKDWWNLKKETINNLNIFNNFGNQFSYSSLDTYNQCPLKYKIKYLFKIEDKEEKISLLMGSIYHEVIKKFFQQNSEYKLSNLINIFHEEMQKYKSQFNFNFYFNEMIQEGDFILQNFYENFVNNYFLENYNEAEDKSNTKKFYCEINFNFELKTKDIIIGKIDFINVIDNKNIDIIDFKSSKTKYSDKEIAEELQLKIYGLAFKYGNFLNNTFLNSNNKNIKLRYYFLGVNKDPFLDILKEDYNEDEVMQKILNIISNIKEENFYVMPKNYMSCHNCNYKIFCEKYYGNEI